MTQPGDRVRIVALNTGTLAGRVATVAALAVLLSLDVLALQETRVPDHSRAAVESAFRHAGWNCVLGSQAADTAGQVQYGAAILSRLPVMPFALPEGLLPVGRGSAVRLHRPVGRPIILINLYLPASSDAQAAS